MTFYVPCATAGTMIVHISEYKFQKQFSNENY